MATIIKQCESGNLQLGGIQAMDELHSDLAANAIPLALLEGELDYQDFLIKRRKLIAEKIKQYYFAL